MCNSIVVKLSERNLLCLLHKLRMPGSRRTIHKSSEEQPGEPSQRVAIVVATDAEVYAGREPPGEMHPDTEQFASAMRVQMESVMQRINWRK